MFRETGCDTAATRELLGDCGVNESNVLQYLALIEQRCCEIMPLYAEQAGGRIPPPVQAEPSEARSFLTQQVRSPFCWACAMAHRARTARKLGAQGGGQSRVGALRLRAPRRAGK